MNRQSLRDRIKLVGNLGEWCRLEDSNPWPPDYKSGALPTELSRRLVAIAPLASNYAKGPALSFSNFRFQFGGLPIVLLIGMGAKPCGG